jgi:cell division protein FtsX
MAKILVVSQVALSLVLMVGACLFLRTLVNLNRVDAGFNKEHVLRLDIDSAITGYKDGDPRITTLFQQIENRVSVLPGVQAARAFLSKVYSVDGETPRTCYGATIFGRFAAEAA